MKTISDQFVCTSENFQMNSITIPIKGDDNYTSSVETTEEGYESLRHSFTYLGIFGKCFGIFPSYNCSFKSKSYRKSKFLNLLDYFYTISIFLLILCGVGYCSLKEPRVVTQLKGGHVMTDYYVITFLFYLTTITGILSYTVFMKKWCPFLKYIEHYSQVDKLLKFDQQRREIIFGRVIFGLTICICITYTMGGLCLFVLDLQEANVSSQVEFITSDWIMVSLTAITGTLLFLPTLYFVFFMNAIKLRLECFNTRIQYICNIFTYAKATPSMNGYKKYCYHPHQSHNEYLYLHPTTSALSTMLTVNHQSYDVHYAKQLEDLRILHEELLVLIEETSAIFGVHLLRSYFYSLVGFILFAYFTLFLKEDFYQFWFLYPVYTVVILIKLFVISSSTHYVYFQGDCLKHILNKVPIVDIHPLSSLQIQLLLRKLDFPVTVNAAGFFSINRCLLTKIIGAITTYFVILLQFKTSDLH